MRFHRRVASCLAAFATAVAGLSFAVAGRLAVAAYAGRRADGELRGAPVSVTGPGSSTDHGRQSLPRA